MILDLVFFAHNDDQQAHLANMHLGQVICDIIMSTGRLSGVSMDIGPVETGRGSGSIYFWTVEQRAAPCSCGCNVDVI
jgi:hypothetical protein